jgi:hypothetical protein
VESGRIEVRANYPRLIFTYAFTLVEIEIDGTVSRHRWGPAMFDVAPGPHSVSVWWRGGFGGGMTERIRVHVNAGETVLVTYHAPITTLQRGQLTSESELTVSNGHDEEVSGADVSDFSDEELLELWRELKQSTGRAPDRRFFLRKSRAELEREMEKRGLAPPA